jgi:hypothetical protein
VIVNIPTIPMTSDVGVGKTNIFNGMISFNVGSSEIVVYSTDEIHVEEGLHNAESSVALDEDDVSVLVLSPVEDSSAKEEADGDPVESKGMGVGEEKVLRKETKRIIPTMTATTSTAIRNL